MKKESKKPTQQKPLPPVGALTILAIVLWFGLNLAIALVIVYGFDVFDTGPRLEDYTTGAFFTTVGLAGAAMIYALNRFFHRITR